jgi:hypothetical protein
MVHINTGEMGMHRLIVTLFLILASIGSYANDANTICRNAGSVVLILHKDVNGTVTENADGNWAVSVPYDILSGGEPNDAGKSVVTGMTSCNTISVKSAADGSSYNGGPATPGDANTFAKMSTANTGSKCWCRMTGPVTSWWTFIREYSDNATCASECNTYCANGFANNTAMLNGRVIRDALIDAVW